MFSFKWILSWRSALAVKSMNCSIPDGSVSFIWTMGAHPWMGNKMKNMKWKLKGKSNAWIEWENINKLFCNVSKTIYCYCYYCYFSWIFPKKHLYILFRFPVSNRANCMFLFFLQFVNYILIFLLNRESTRRYLCISRRQLSYDPAIV